MGRLTWLAEAWTKKPVKVLVVGDVGVDRWFYGTATRLSPEAPVPVLNITETTISIGMAGNVCAMIAALGGRPTIATVLGGSSPRIPEPFNHFGDPPLFVRDPHRPTPMKIRAMGRSPGRTPHQLLRMDVELTDPITGDIESRLCGLLAENDIKKWDAVVISDYGKGTCTVKVCRLVIDSANRAPVPVLVDPARGSNWMKYRDADCIKCNQLEFEQGVYYCMGQIPPPRVIVTRDRDGCTMNNPHHATGDRVEFPTTPVESSDPTGCGDQFMAALVLAVAAGASWEEGCWIANTAGALQAARIGCTPVTHEQLLTELATHAQNHAWPPAAAA